MSNLVNYSHYIGEFQSFEKNGASQLPSWIHEIRKSALNVFTERGFPTTKEENWKYTNVNSIAKGMFTYASNKLVTKIDAEIIESFFPEGKDHHRIVFVNGHLSKEHSKLQNLPKEVVVRNLIEATKTHGGIIQQHLSRYVDYRNNSFAAMNTAFLNDGVFMYIPKNIEVKGPIYCLFISTQFENDQLAAHLRNLIIVEEDAKVKVSFVYRSVYDHKNLTNAVTEIVVKERANFEAVKIQQESDSAFHVENLRVHQHESSIVNVFSLALGSILARNDMSIILDGKEADCNLNGLYITTDNQVIDHHTFMHHIHPNCPSHELFKGILHGNSRAVFNGKVYVEPEAQKTDSKQTNRNLLLSDTATVDTKPELEIFADDVKCTHGAAVGGLNPTYAFYLKSRGISEENTRAMLTVGFAAEVTGKIVDQELRHYVDVLVVEHLRNKLGNTGLPDIVHG